MTWLKFRARCNDIFGKPYHIIHLNFTIQCLTQDQLNDDLVRLFTVNNISFNVIDNNEFRSGYMKGKPSNLSMPHRTKLTSLIKEACDKGKQELKKILNVSNYFLQGDFFPCQPPTDQWSCALGRSSRSIKSGQFLSAGIQVWLRYRLWKFSALKYQREYVETEKSHVKSHKKIPVLDFEWFLKIPFKLPQVFFMTVICSHMVCKIRIALLWKISRRSEPISIQPIFPFSSLSAYEHLREIQNWNFLMGFNIGFFNFHVSPN